MTSVDVVIVSYNSREVLRACLHSLTRNYSELNSGKIVVVDNASTDGSPQMVTSEFPQVELLTQSENIGFGPANNRGFQSGTAPCVLFLNSDACVRSRAISTLQQSLLSDESIMAAGPRLVYPDGSFHPSCRRFPTVIRGIWQLSGMEARLGRPRVWCNWLTEEEHRNARYVDMVSGACFMVKRALFEELGLFDERLFLYEEEMDIFLRARRMGLSVVYEWKAVVEHHHGASSGERSGNPFVLYHQFRSKYFCFRKHYGTFRARSMFWSDQTILGLSSMINRLRGTPSTTDELRRISQKAFADAMTI